MDDLTAGRFLKQIKKVHNFFYYLNYKSKINYFKTNEKECSNMSHVNICQTKKFFLTSFRSTIRVF